LVLLDRYKVLDITAWGLIFVKVVKIFEILKKGCWAVSHLRGASLGGCDVPGCNYTCGRLSTRAGDKLALSVRCRPTVLVGRFSNEGGGGEGVQCTSGT
jgi:hypothetical protein